MPAIIYEKTPGALIPTGDRTVSTFPSGLVRVDQTFVCNTSAVNDLRAELAVGNDFPNGAYPSLDGLKIFPNVQEVQRTDGFTEFKVSAYGRTNITGTTRKTTKEFWSQNYEEEYFVAVFRAFKSKDHTTSRIVIASEEYDPEPDKAGIALPELISGVPVGTTDPYILTQIGAQQINSYGFFEEIITTYGYVGIQIAG